MQVGIFKDANEAARAAAEIIIDAFSINPQGTLGVATGSTPLPLYEQLRQAHRDGKFSLAEAQAFALDEYVGLPVDHEQGYRTVLRTELVGEDKTGLTEQSLHTPNGHSDDHEAAAIEYDDQIAEAGVDLQILGIGADGHIGFNEPSGSLSSRTHVGVLTQQTRQDNARFFENIDQVPTHCITQGLGTIMDAGTLVLLATGKNKAQAVKELVEGAVSSRWPATIMQFHPDVYVLVDEDAASELELSDYYREVWNS